MIQYLKKLDWILVISVLLLTGIGLLSIYSISLGKGDFFNLKKQFVFIGVGLVLMILVSFFDWRGFRDNPYFILVLYFVCIGLLTGLFLFAPEIRGIKSWYKIGYFSYDPIGITTLVLVILLAKFFSIRHIEMYRLSHILLSGLYILIPFILISRQPNLGSALILIVLWTGILLVSGIKLKHFFILALFGLLFVILSWQFILKDYQRERVISYLAPQIEPLGASWSQNQAKIAIGSAGFLGKGFGSGSQTQHGFLTEPHTDFIFSSIAEEFGLMGVMFLLLLYGVLIWRIMKIAISATTNFPRLFAVGFSVVLMSQIFIHIGMNLGILPVIGIPLPLVSYGGNNLIAILIGIGVLESIKSH